MPCWCCYFSLFHPPSRRPTPLTPIMLSWWNGNKKKKITQKHPKFILFLPFSFSLPACIFPFRRIFIFWWPRCDMRWKSRTLAKNGEERRRGRPAGGTRYFHSLSSVFFLAFIWCNMQRTATVWAAKKKIIIIIPRPASHPQYPERERKEKRDDDDQVITKYNVTFIHIILFLKYFFYAL